MNYKAETEHQTNKKYQYLMGGACVLLLLILEWFYFRERLNLTDLFGDFGDGKFCSITTEHWFRFIRGKESFSSINMFYPTKGTLAYSDMLFMYAPLYCLLRVFGVDMFLSYKITLIGIHLIGTFAMAWFLRKYIACSPLATMVGTVIFAYANPYITSEHTQLYAYFLVPVLLCTFFGFLRNGEQKKKRIPYGLISVVLLAGIFYTSFYIGYFMVVFLMVWGAILLLRMIVLRDGSFSKCLAYVKQTWKMWCVYGALTLLCMIPFLLIELPIMKEFGGRDWSIVCAGTPKLSMIFRVHTGNFMNQIFSMFSDNLGGEYTEGFGIFTIVCLFAFLIYKGLKKEWDLIWTVGLAILGSILIIVQWKEGVSIWYVAYRFLPGASAIRMSIRFLMFLNLPLGIFFGSLWTDWEKKGKEATYQRGICYAATVVFLLQFVWTGSHMSMWNRPGEIAMVEEVPNPPADCQVMFCDNIPDQENFFSCIYWDLSANLIANRYDLKCINGYSGQIPKGLVDFYIMGRKNYHEILKKWSKQNQLQGVYGYDVTNHQWIKLEVDS